MTHTGVVSLTEIKNVKEVQTVTQTDDHFLKDFVPYVSLKVKGRLSPLDMRIIQGEKGMVVLDIQCCVPTCPNDPVAGSYTYVSVSPIMEEFEKGRITAWVEDLKEKIKGG